MRMYFFSELFSNSWYGCNIPSCFPPRNLVGKRTAVWGQITHLRRQITWANYNRAARRKIAEVYSPIPRSLQDFIYVGIYYLKSLFQPLWFLYQKYLGLLLHPFNKTLGNLHCLLLAAGKQHAPKTTATA